ncbi:MAG: 4-hydroxy-3-methylbut-2-enyl diphosphate reductase, partial [Anaerovorax sp.]
MTITLAKNSGFCFGVKEAIKKTEDTIYAYTGCQEPIYTCGPLIHNKMVTDELQAKGAKIITHLSQAEENAVVIVRSHGEGQVFFEKAKKQGITIVDATCPFVKKIHKLVKDGSAQGKAIVVVGDRNHPEVKGINGWCHGEAIIVDHLEEAKKITVDDILLVAQTTMTTETFDAVKTWLLENKSKVEVHNTICHATMERQKSCMETARKSDLMIIIGGKNSSNSKKLYEIAKKHCKNTHFIEKIEHLPLKEVEKCNKIGVAAGASTPERIIEEVIATMSEMNTENHESNLMHEMMAEIEKSLRLPRSGEIVT